ncbi:MAG: M20/M25/M40 family metallo-hydrolase [Clostridia bacterium]|nr:M20/M25/M40 family metallo-hydrolase [Clostridia bacterium]
MNELTKKVFDKIDELSDKYLNVLIDACNIESKTEDKEGVDKVGAYFAAIAENMGYVIKKREFEKAGNVYSFTCNPTGKKKPISLSGHMDTVHKKGIFGYPTTKIDGDYVYGPGVNDCKGNIAVELLVMEALKSCGYDERPVKLILQSDEEVNSYLSDQKSLEFMVEEAKGSAAFLNAENIGAERKLTIGRKGITAHKITITGKKFHAGWCTKGASAIKEAAYKIIEFEKDNDNDAITFNCGIINSGTATNIVPDLCELFVEYRFKNMEQKKIADEKFKKIVETSYVEGTHAEAERISNRLPLEPDEKNKNLVNTINDICKQVGIEPFGMAETPGGADSAYPSLAGIPTVDSIGIEGSGCHTLNECARISSMAEMAKVVAAVIINFPE